MSSQGAVIPDPRMLTPSLLRPSNNSLTNLNNLKVDQNHPLAKKMAEFYIFNGISPRCLITGNGFTLTGSAEFSSGFLRLTGDPDTNYLEGIFVPPRRADVANVADIYTHSFSLKLKINTDSLQSSAFQFAGSKSAGSPSLLVAPDASSNIRVYFDNSFRTLSNATIGEWFTVTFSIIAHTNSDLEYFIYCNGEEEYTEVDTTPSSQGSLSSLDRFWLHNGAYVGSSFDVEYEYLWYSIDFFTENEVKKLYENPYQILIPT